MRTITFEDAHRRAHFEHFAAMAQPHFGVTANVDVTDLLAIVRASPTLRFTPAIVYLITKAALSVEPFTYRLRGKTIVAHDAVRPSWAVPTRQSAAFSFCTVAYQQDPVAFHAAAVRETERMNETPSFSDEPGADDYLYLSAFPWASFTSVQHAMAATPEDSSVPRIVWGKYFKRDDRKLMPLAVQAHHALVDGSDLGRYYQTIERELRAAEQIFADFARK